ncbi:hypothetical protein ABXN44_002595 [Listeria monocytogenes]
MDVDTAYTKCMFGIFTQPNGILVGLENLEKCAFYEGIAIRMIQIIKIAEVKGLVETDFLFEI